MLISKNFSPETDKMIKCPCCYRGQLPLALICILEDVRRHFKKPVKINSGARCKHYNAQVGGAEFSKHLLQKINDDYYTLAVDIEIDGVKPFNIAFYVLDLPYNHLLGVGIYDTFVHIDIRGSLLGNVGHQARWDYRTDKG